MAVVGRRALHYVLKIGDRVGSINFFVKTLGMKVLRHEEFSEGCKATCNGPYDGKWSKTMVGYGPEDCNFVLELTYNYGVGSYQRGNDLAAITVHLPGTIGCNLLDPDGHKFILVDEATEGIAKVSINTPYFDKSLDFWRRLCGMEVYELKPGETALLGYGADQCKLELIACDEALNRGTGFGRIAFSCPAAELPAIESRMVAEGQLIINSLTSLDTPGKPTVQVVILGDPNGHEICFVGDESFCELSRVDSRAEFWLQQAMEQDNSAAWYAGHGGKPEG